VTLCFLTLCALVGSEKVFLNTYSIELNRGEGTASQSGGLIPSSLCVIDD